MPASDYPPPVDRLFDFGDARDATSPDTWPDYRSLGLGPEHVPDLIRLTRDWPRHWKEGEDGGGDDDEGTAAVSNAFWAPVHAWRALGQLGAAGAVDPLLETLTEMHADDELGDEWTAEELPDVFALIGPPAVPALAAYLAGEGRPLYALVEAAHGLAKIVKRHPGERERVADVLRQAMSRFDRQDPVVNGFLLSYLLDLKATEAAPVVREAFRAGKVDETIAGGWGDVRKEWHLGPQPDDPPEVSAADRWRERYPGLAKIQRAVNPPPEPPDPFVAPVAPPQRALDRHKEKAKAKRKQAKAARKQNRRRR